MRHSTSLTVFLSLSLLACSGSSTDEATDSGAVDTSADTASEDVVVVRNFSVTNCNTGAAVEGFEICDSPTVSGVETCGTTDANGQTSTTWVNPPLASDVWIKGTHPEYSTGIATGFYDEDGYNATLELIESGGSVQGNLCFFNKATSSTFLAGGELVAEEGMGQVWFVLYSNDNDDYDINNDQRVSGLDALTVINEVAAGRYIDETSGMLLDPTEVDPWPGIYYDNNGDGRATALDALGVINHLGRASNLNESEGEQLPTTANTSLASSVPAYPPANISMDRSILFAAAYDGKAMCWIQAPKRSVQTISENVNVPYPDVRLEQLSKEQLKILDDVLMLVFAEEDGRSTDFDF